MKFPYCMVAELFCEIGIGVILDLAFLSGNSGTLQHDKAMLMWMEEKLMSGRVALKVGDLDRQKVGFMRLPSMPNTMGNDHTGALERLPQLLS